MKNSFDTIQYNATVELRLEEPLHNLVIGVTNVIPSFLRNSKVKREPRYNETCFEGLVPWPFVISSFHCINFS